VKTGIQNLKKLDSCFRRNDELPKEPLLSVVSQLQFHGVGIQIDLFLEIGLIVFTHVMTDEHNRNNQRNKFLSVVIDDFQ
jgi:hypothetical protein